MLDALANRYQLNELLRDNMPRLKLILYQMERLMQMHLPEVYGSLNAKEITCEMFSVQWFVTLFSYDFDSPFVYIIWDLFLLRKWKFLFQLALAILQQMAPQIDSLPYEELLSFIKNCLRDGQLNPVLKHPIAFVEGDYPQGPAAQSLNQGVGSLAGRIHAQAHRVRLHFRSREQSH